MDKNIKKKKILIITPSNDLGGVSRYILQFIEILSINYEVFLLSGNNGDSLFKEAERYGVKTISFSLEYSWFRLPFIVSKLRRIIKDNQIDIIHAHTTRAGFISSLVKKSKNKLVFTGHSWRFLQKNNPISKFIFYLIVKYICLRSDYVTCISNTEYQQGLRYRLITSSFSSIIQFSLDFEEYTKNDSLESEWRNKLFLYRFDKIVVTSGRIVYEKDHETFLKTAEFVLEQKPNLLFLWIGGGGLEEQMKEKINTMGLDKNVVITGFISREEVLCILSMSDIFILTSRIEAFPLVILEAMMLKKPVVVSEVGGIPEIVRDNNTGLLFNKGDYKQASEKIIKLLDNQELFKMLSFNAFSLVKENFSPKSKMGYMFLKVYNKICNE